MIGFDVETLYRDQAARLRPVSATHPSTGDTDEVSVETVSGDAHLKLGSLAHAHVDTISGELSMQGTLDPNAQLDERRRQAVRREVMARPSGGGAMHSPPPGDSDQLDALRHRPRGKSS